MLVEALNLMVIVAWAVLGLTALVAVLITARRSGPLAALRYIFSLRLTLFLLIGAAAITMLSRSLIFIPPGQAGVVVSLIAPDGYRDRPLRSGLHWVAPLLEQIHTYPIGLQTYTMSSVPSEGQTIGNDSIAARTSDGQEVTIDCSLIFQIEAEQVIQVHIDLQNRYVQDFVRPIARGIVRTQVSQYKADEVNSSKRLDLEQDMEQQIRDLLQEKGFVLNRFVLRNISFSPEYAASIEQKQVAQQETLQREYEAKQIAIKAGANASAVRIEAQAEADAISMRAAAEAARLHTLAAALESNPELLTYNYIDKLSPNVRVMLVPNNAPYLLPAPDAITAAEPAAAPVDAASAVSPTIQLSIGTHRLNVELATEPAQHRIGLSQRSSLAADGGMLFVFDADQPLTFTSRETRVPLSVAFLDEKGVILNFEDLEPGSEIVARSAGPARYALEVNRGWFERNQISAGDRAVFILPAITAAR